MNGDEVSDLYTGLTAVSRWVLHYGYKKYFEM
jgi:ribosomal protein L15E